MQASHPVPSTELPPYTEKDAQQLWSIPAPPAQPSRLPLPVCVPQVTSNYDSPFVRAYSQQLQMAQISLDEWLSFCDGLNIAMTSSPPLRVVDRVNKALGFVPYHWAIIRGALMQTSAQPGQQALSKTLTDRYLRQSNEHFFAPRGLRVRLCKTLAMRQLIGLDAAPTQPVSSTMQFAKGAGRAVENVALRLPIPFLGRVVEAVSRPVPHVAVNMPMDVTSRRLADLGGYACPLDFNVPPARTPAGLMDQFNGLGAKLNLHRANRHEVKAARQRQLLAIRQGQALPGSRMAPAGGLMNAGGLLTGGRRERKAARRAARDERSGYLPGERGGRHMRIRVAKADRLEYNATEALVWIVILNADQDRMIEGTPLIDGTEDHEVVDESDWEDQLELEDDEEEAFAKAEKEAPPAHPEMSFMRMYSS